MLEYGVGGDQEESGRYLCVCVCGCVGVGDTHFTLSPSARGS